jgi:A118 family predicted phage portal protein
LPLPENTQKLPWPPKQHEALLQDAQEADAWYSGDPDKLMAFYGGQNFQSTTKQNSFEEKSFGVSFSGGISFWSRRATDTGYGRQRLHVPVAGDIASVASDLLFGEEPTIQIPEAHGETAEDGAAATEERLQELIEQLSVNALLHEAADAASGLGGVYLRPGWDPQLADHPIMTVVHGDQALPQFSQGMLRKVTFWRVVKQHDKRIYRHLEIHEPGVIYHGLYLGDADLLGDNIPLDTLAETASLQDAVQLPGGIKDLLVSYIPNTLPNRKRRVRIGRADTAGAEDLMDAIDEIWTSWMKDIRLGQAKIFVPSDWLKRTGRGEGASFDVDESVYVKLDVDPMSKEAAKVDFNQFLIRHEEHRASYLEAFKQVVHAAGYSPQSFGMEVDGQAESGTALKIREGRSFKTTKKKRRYFEPAIASALHKLLIIDATIFKSGVTPLRPRVKCNDMEPDQMQVASTVAKANEAEAMSTMIRVKSLQPHLEGEELDAEVKRVLEEKGISVPDPTGGLV